MQRESERSGTCNGTGQRDRLLEGTVKAFGLLAPGCIFRTLTAFTHQPECRFSLPTEVILVRSTLHFNVLSVHYDAAKTRRRFERS